MPRVRPFGRVVMGSAWGPNPVVPVARLVSGRSLFDADWWDAHTGRSIIAAGGRLEGVERFLRGYLSHADAKTPDGDRHGWLRETYAVTALAITHKGKETVLPGGTDDLGSLLGGAEQRYAPTDPDEVRNALPLLRALPPEERQQLPQRLGLTPRRLRDVLAGRAVPRPDLRTRLITLADVVRRSGGRLPPLLDTARGNGRTDEAFDLIAALRARGWSVARIADVAHVSRQTAWRWHSRITRPRSRHLEHLRAALQNRHQE